jgi:hypothetical protein
MKPIHIVELVGIMSLVLLLVLFLPEKNLVGEAFGDECNKEEIMEETIKFVQKNPGININENKKYIINYFSKKFPRCNNLFEGVEPEIKQKRSFRR